MSVLAATFPREPADPGRRASFRSLLNAARTGDLELPALFEGFAEALPFRLGESRAEAAVPFAVSDDLDGALGAAVSELLELLRRRHEPRGVHEARDARAALASGEADREGRLVRLLPPSYAAPPMPPGAARAAVSALGALDPHLDPVLGEAWLRGAAADAQGEVQRLFAAALEEDIRAHGQGRVGYLAALAVVARCDAHKAQAKSFALKLSYERLEKAVGLALWALVDAAAGVAIAGLGARRLPFDLTVSTGLLRTALDPLSFVSIRSRTLQNDLNPWGLAGELALALEPLYAELLAEDPDPLSLERRLERAILERPLAPTVVPAARLSLARERGLEALALLDGRDPELAPELEKAIRHDADLLRLCADPRAIAARVARVARLPQIDAAGRAAAERFAEACRVPSFEDAARRAASCFVSFALDRFAADRLDAARARLRDRRGEMSPSELRADYERGRLYRLAGDGKPLWKPLQRKAEGHLFVDLKGYTQRTHRAKEVVMAEFLREEFYKPILNGASSLLRAHPGPPGRLRLQNLLGDAAAFSGEVPLLVSLAKRIQRICASYGDTLSTRTSGVRPEEVAAKRDAAAARLEADVDRLDLERSLLAAEVQRKKSLSPDACELLLHEQYARRVSELTRRRNDALTRATSDPDPAHRAAAKDEVRRCDGAIAALDARGREVFQRLDELSGPIRAAAAVEWATAAEVRRIAELDQAIEARRRAGDAEVQALEEELRSARGFGLEAGLFIAFGAEAERVRIADETFGDVQVAVAEKLNEAARGTARNAQLKQKLDGQLERLRRARGESRLALPFRVHVDASVGLILPPELSAALEGAVRSRDPGEAAHVAQAVHDELARELGRARASGDGQGRVLALQTDIYNVGEALSGEALDAFVRETLATHYHFAQSVRVESLHGELRERFAFLEPSIELLIAVPHGDVLAEVLVFRLAGHVHFRGFEGKGATAVYELVRDDEPFFTLLREHHLAAWAAEAREDPARLLTSLVRAPS